MTTQIGIPVYKFKGDILNDLVKLAEENGLEKSYCAGERYFSINREFKIWFTHTTNEYYPDAEIINTKNPLPEIKKLLKQFLSS
jgi:hypothetical protein